MKRKLLTVTIGITLLGAGLAWIATGEESPFVIPLEPVKSYRAFSKTAGTASLFFRNPDGTYARLSFGISSPYRLLTSLASLGSLISNPAFISAPAGPANVGRAGQLGAGGVFTSTGNLGGAYAFPGSTRVTVYLGTTAFLFTGSTTYTVSSPISSLIAQDLNGDQVLDLVLSLQRTFGANATTGGVGVMLNRGDGTFAPMVKYTAGTSGHSVAAADLNKDGFTDVVVGDAEVGTIQVLLGNGDGTLRAPVGYASPITQNWSVTIADVTGDGNLDIAGAGFSAITVLPGNGDGTFRAGQQWPTRRGALWAIAAGDFTGDGRLDLAVANGPHSAVTVFRNTGSGQFEEGDTYAVSYRPESLIVADINKDGKLDIVNGIGDARWFGPSLDSFTNDFLYGRGDGTFDASPMPFAGQAVNFIAAADFNGDGSADAVTNDASRNNLLYFPGQAGGRLAVMPQTISLGSGTQVQPTGGVTGDFNGDQRPDLAITERGVNRVAILLGGASGLQPAIEYPSGASQPEGIAAADFDGDGRLDLAVTHTGNGMTSILKGSPSGFEVQSTYPTGTQPTWIAAGDFTGDGRADLAVVERTETAKIYLLRNNGSGSFTALTPLTVGRKALTVALKDVNKDGKTDIVAASDGAGFDSFVSVLLGNGDGTFQAPTNLATDFGPTATLVEDFDGDGNADILVLHCCGSTTAGYYRGTGGGTFAAERLMDTPVSPQAGVVTKLNPSDTSSPPDVIVATNEGSLIVMPNVQRSLRNRNSASYIPGELSPDMIVTAEANGIAPALLVAQQTPWPMELGGVRVTITDSAGTTNSAPIYYVSTSAVSYLLPANTAIGLATVKVRTSTGREIQEQIYVNPVAPGIYSANSSGSGAAAAFYLRVAASGARTQDLVFDNNLNPAALDLSPTGDQVYLLLYGTGFRNGSTVTAQVGGRSVPVLGTAAHSIYQGLDQVNLGPLPRTLIGAGVVNVTLTIDGRATNPVTVRIQ